MNINEAKVLIASADSTMSGELNIDEFMDLLFNENDTVNVELSRLSPGDRFAKIENEEKYSGELKELAYNAKTRQQLSRLKILLKAKTANAIATFIVKDKNKTGLTTFHEFCDVIDQLEVPSQFISNKLLKLFFLEYGGARETLNYRQFINDLGKFE